MSGGAGGSSTRSSWGPLAVAAGVPVLVVAVDLALGRGIFDEGAPVLDATSVARSTALVVAVLALLIAVRRATDIPGLAPWPTWARPGVVVTLVLTVAATVLVVADPVAYSRAAVEDGLVENLTSLFFAVGGASLLAVALSRARSEHALLRWGAGVLGAGFILSAGEEISWGQRILGFGTPDVLSENLQNEANLHNLATDPLEAAFYCGCALLFVLLPFVLTRVQLSPRLARLAPLLPLVPAAWIAVVAAPSTAMNLDMWDVVAVQLTVWAALGVLVVIAHDRRQASDGIWRLVVLTAVVTVAVQVVALATADTVVELHDVTEYKEFFLGLIAAMYGLDVLARRRGQTVATSGSSRPRSSDSSSSDARE